MAQNADERTRKLSGIARNMEGELESILDFWMKNTVDNEYGGFYGLITNDMAITKDAPKGGILNSRILWTFSAAYKLTHKGEYLKMAEHAYDFMLNHFIDREYGGVYWMVDYKGNVTSDRKQIYNIAFAIYALSEYSAASGKEEPLQLALKLFELIEKHAVDPVYGGYIEALTRKWEPIEDLRLSDKDMNEKKSMNTHLHVLEAYTNLVRVSHSPRAEKSLKELIDITAEKIIDPSTHHFKLFFDDEWHNRADIDSYGHDIEGSWLLYEAATVAGYRVEEMAKIADEMAQATLKEAFDSQNGGIYYEKKDGHLDTGKQWWPEAEAVVGFTNAYELTGKEEYLNAAEATWRFIDRYVVDHQYGEWYAEVSADGKPDLDQPKVEPWKCPYHNGRSCIELIQRAKLPL